ncbi:MAG: hypothetical protein R3B67_05735 [Phycisphaerales bacterium]
MVRAVAMGEIDVGLTDTDDVWSGQQNGWKVDFASLNPLKITSHQRAVFPSSGSET